MAYNQYRRMVRRLVPSCYNRETDSGLTIMLREPRGRRPPEGTTAREAMHFLSIALGFSLVVATVFTVWTPTSLRPGELADRLIALMQGQAGPTTPTPVQGLAPQGVKIGVVAGHAGINPDTGVLDPGSQCPDGLTEVQVNQVVAERVADGLEALGFQVDLLDEFDERLVQYRAVALVSVHADTCAYVNDQATGFKVSGALDTSIPDRTQRLVDCVADRYARTTGLVYRSGSITRDMTDYHTFREIHTQTPAVIIETGFLYLDREFLTQQPDVAARGIVDGLLCYIYNEPAPLPLEAIP